MKFGVKKKEADLVKKDIVQKIKLGRTVKAVKRDLSEKYSPEFAEFILKGFCKKEKTDVEWLKEYRSEVEVKKKTKEYENLLSYALASGVIAAVMWYVLKQFEMFQNSFESFGVGLFDTLIIAFRLMFWGSIFVFVISICIAVYKRYLTYIQNKKRFRDRKLKKAEETEIKPEEKPKIDNKTKTIPSKKTNALDTNKIISPKVPNKISTKKYNRQYILSPDLKEKLEKLSEKKK